MKKLIILLSFVCLLLAACSNGKDRQIKTQAFNGKQNYLLTFAEDDFPIGDSIYVTKSYSVVWPASGMLSQEAMDELMALYFGDSSSTDIKEAIQQWLEDMGYYDDWEVEVMKDDSIDENRALGYDNIEASCRQDSTLVTFLVRTESFVPHAAHGLYSADYLTVDMSTGNAIHLNDLVTDTTLLCEAIAHAIQDLEVNKDVRDCLFDEFIDAERMPMTRNFFIDSTRSCIIVNYGLYEIACYACGIQSVTLPIFWLSKHVPLTPYAKQLFGPGCSLE